MTEKTNIQLFDEVTARIFARLYESFPVSLEINCIELTKGDEIDDDGSPTKESRICMATLKWLHDEGYIKLDSLGRHEAYGIILTAKGLSSLKAVPNSLETKKSIGEKLVTAVNSGAISTAVEVLKLIFTIG